MLQLLQSPDLPLAELRGLLTSTKYEIPTSVIRLFDENLAAMNAVGVGCLLDFVDTVDKILFIDNNMNESKSFLSNNTGAIARTSIVGEPLILRNDA